MTAPADAGRGRGEPGGRGAPLLRVRELSVRFDLPGGTVRAVDGVSFSIRPGQALGIVGESGAGKSASVLALSGLLPGTARVHGSIVFDGQELIGLPARSWRRLRGRRIAMAFTESVTALDPVRSVGGHLLEAVRAHRVLNRRDALAEASRALTAAGLTVSRDLLRSYPHELSGGMRQRVMIAMAVVHDPELIILDEPTSSLDVDTRSRLLRTLAGLREDSGAAIVLVTHDLAAAADLCDRLLVMRAGRIVEAGPTRQLLRDPRQPYTAGLLRAEGLDLSTGLDPGGEPWSGSERAPALEREPEPGLEPGPEPEGARVVRPMSEASPRSTATPLLEVRDLVVRYPRRREPGRPGATAPVTAVDGVSLTLYDGESLGLVGRSGAGKTSLVRAVLQLRRPDSGSVLFAGRELTTLSGRGLRAVRARLQIVLQDPFASLDPRMSVGAIVAEPLRIHRQWRSGGPERVGDLIRRVGLDPGHLDRYPHELSAGQRQRVALARALALHPRVLVLDEPVSALDVSVRAEIVALLAGLRDSLGLTYLVISHDPTVVRQLCDRVVVLSRGRAVAHVPVAGYGRLVGRERVEGLETGGRGGAGG